MEQKLEDIDLEDILTRAITVYNKSYNFYTLSKKNMNERKKLKKLRLLGLFPMVGTLIKNYQTVHDLSYNNYLDTIFNQKHTKKDIEMDKRNIELLFKDIKTVYDEYFNGNTHTQTGGSKIETPEDSTTVDSTTVDSNTDTITINIPKENTPDVVNVTGTGRFTDVAESDGNGDGNESEDVITDNIKKHIKDIIGAVCKTNEINLESIKRLLGGNIDIDLYGLITGEEITPETQESFKLFCSQNNLCTDWSEERFQEFFKKNIDDEEEQEGFNRKQLYLQYNLTKQLSAHLKKIFPSEDTVFDYINPNKSLKRLSNFLKLYSEYEDIIIAIVNNIMRLKREGVNNPFLIIIDTIQTLVASVMELKNTVSDMVSTFTAVLNLVALIIQGIISATGAGAAVTGTGTGTAGAHTALGSVNMIRILIDFAAPYVIFFSLIVLKQDEHAAKVLIDAHPLAFGMPVNIAHSVMDIISKIVNIKQLCMLLELSNDQGSMSASRILEKIYIELQMKKIISLDPYDLSQLQIVDGLKIKISNIIMCQLIDILSFEGTSILLHLNIQKNIINIYNSLEQAITTILKKMEQGYDIVTSPVQLNILRLLFGMKYTDKFIHALIAPVLTNKIVSNVSPEDMTITSENLENLKAAFTELKLGGILGGLVNIFSKKKPEKKINTTTTTTTTTITNPVVTIVNPTDAVDAPTDAVDAPTDAVDAPTDAVDAPTDAVDAPTDAVDAPTDAVDAPTDAVDAPTDAVDAPRDAVDAPTDAVDAPTDAVDAPTDAVDAPTDTATPVTAAATPVTAAAATPVTAAAAATNTG
jgi:hypothetical protein